MKGKTMVLAAVILLAGAAKAYCEAPNLMTYQGRLKESGVQASGPRSVEIKLCPDETGNDASCRSTGPQQVTVANGLFRSTFTVPSSVDLTTGFWYLELWVGTGKFSPRERLSSVAYSIYATSASALAAAPDTAGVTVSTNLIISGAQLKLGGFAAAPAASALGGGALYYNTGDALLYYSNGASWSSLAAGGLSPWTSGGGNTTLNAAGDLVGVGKVPSEKLDVAGNIRADYGIAATTMTVSTVTNSQGFHFS